MATAILADINVIGHFNRMVAVAESGEWEPYWTAFGLPVATFERFGLDPNTPDRLLWDTCQREGLLLVTANRNDDGLDSLGAAIRETNSPHALPVFTIADHDRVLVDSAYAERVVVKLLDYLMRLDEVRGTGRLYLP